MERPEILILQAPQHMAEPDPSEVMLRVSTPHPHAQTFQSEYMFLNIKNEQTLKNRKDLGVPLVAQQ